MTQEKWWWGAALVLGEDMAGGEGAYDSPRLRSRGIGGASPLRDECSGGS